jgi:toxin ParE1/3/4
VSRYRLWPRAEAQVEQLTRFIAEQNADAARRVKTALHEAFELLADMPEVGHTRRDLTKHPFKFWPVHSYLIIYDPAASPLEIHAVVHGRRDLARILRDL